MLNLFNNAAKKVSVKIKNNQVKRRILTRRKKNLKVGMVL